MTPDGHLLNITPKGAETDLTLEWKIVRGKAGYYARWRLPAGARKGPNTRYKWKALGTDDVVKAKRLALNWWKTMSAAVEDGQALDVPLFKKAAERWLADFYKDTQIEDAGRPRKSKAEYVRYTSCVNRYLIPYFGHFKVTQIPSARRDSYEKWRKDYYLTGPGAKEEVIPYKRGNKKMSRPAVKYDTPAHSTLNKDIVAFNNIITYARREMGVQFVEEPTIELRRRKNVRSNQRAFFDDEELALLMRSLGERCFVKNRATKRARKLLYHFCALMLHSGLRVSEAYNLRVGDITEYDYRNVHQVEVDYVDRMRMIQEGKYFSITESERKKLAGKTVRLKEIEELNDFFNESIAQDIDAHPELKEKFDAAFSAPKKWLRAHVATTKDETLTRNAVLDHECKAIITTLKMLLLTTVDKEALKGAKTIDQLPLDLPLFCHTDGKKVARFDHSFDEALIETKSARYPNGLAYDIRGKKRSLTSFRHCYGTRKLLEGADIKALADQMGTDVKMIEKHYDHVLKELRSVSFL